MMATTVWLEATSLSFLKAPSDAARLKAEANGTSWVVSLNPDPSDSWSRRDGYGCSVSLDDTVYSLEWALVDGDWSFVSGVLWADGRCSSTTPADAIAAVKAAWDEPDDEDGT